LYMIYLHTLELSLFRTLHRLLSQQSISASLTQLLSASPYPCHLTDTRSYVLDYGVRASIRRRIGCHHSWGADRGRLMVLRVARNENVWRRGRCQRWETASAASSVGGSGLARNLDFALLCLPFLQSRQCLLRLVHGDAQQRILGAASECLR
jgi:hypothetical protein